jgi:hypothetical protein
MFSHTVSSGGSAIVELEFYTVTPSLVFELMHERLHRSHFAADHAIGAYKVTLQTSCLIERSYKKRSEDATTKLLQIHHMRQLVTVRGWQSCCTLGPGFRSMSRCAHWTANFAASHTIGELSLCLLTELRPKARNSSKGLASVSVVSFIDVSSRGIFALVVRKTLMRRISAELPWVSGNG